MGESARFGRRSDVLENLLFPSVLLTMGRTTYWITLTACVVMPAKGYPCESPIWPSVRRRLPNPCLVERFTFVESKSTSASTSPVGDWYFLWFFLAKTCWHFSSPRTFFGHFVNIQIWSKVVFATQTSIGQMQAPLHCPEPVVDNVIVKVNRQANHHTVSCYWHERGDWLRQPRLRFELATLGA